jgi:hypothetical protein
MLNQPIAILKAFHLPQIILVAIEIIVKIYRRVADFEVKCRMLLEVVIETKVRQ